jgi:hypothetical protein
MRDLTGYADEDLRDLQDHAITELFGACAEATIISQQMTALPALAGDLYRRMFRKWDVKITEARKWGETVQRVTAEIERRARARKAEDPGDGETDCGGGIYYARNH